MIAFDAALLGARARSRCAFESVNLRTFSSPLVREEGRRRRRILLRVHARLGDGAMQYIPAYNAEPRSNAPKPINCNPRDLLAKSGLPK